MIDNKISKKLKKIKLLLSDVDGVLTDGKITICSDGTESKSFCIEDGTAVAIAKFANLEIALLSGRFSKSTDIRASELKIKYCLQGYLDKKNKLNELCKKMKLTYNEIAYIGDGIVDIPVLEIVGVPISVPNAHRLVKSKSIYTTKTKGGEGVLQEVVEMILKSQNRYDNILEKMKKAKF